MAKISELPAIAPTGKEQVVLFDGEETVRAFLSELKLDDATGSLLTSTILAGVLIAVPIAGDTSALRVDLDTAANGEPFDVLIVAANSKAVTRLTAGGIARDIVNLGAVPIAAGDLGRGKIATFAYSIAGGGFVLLGQRELAIAGGAPSSTYDDDFAERPWGNVDFNNGARHVAAIAKYVVVPGSSNANAAYVPAAQLPASVAAGALNEFFPGDDMAFSGITVARAGAPMVDIASQLAACPEYQSGQAGWVIPFFWMNDARSLFYHDQGGILAEIAAMRRMIPQIRTKGAEPVLVTGFPPDPRASATALDPDYFADTSRSMTFPAVKAAPVDPEADMYPPRSAQLTPPTAWTATGIKRMGYKRIEHVNRLIRELAAETGCVLLDLEYSTYLNVIERVADLGAGLDAYYNQTDPLHPKPALYEAAVTPVLRQWAASVAKGDTSRRVFRGEPTMTAAIIEATVAQATADARAAADRAVAIGAKLQAVIDAETVNYFVSSVTGSDVLDGKTDATAWRTDTSVKALGMAIAGKPIGLARGSEFRRFDLTADHVRIQGYGDPSLPLPILDSSIPLLSAAWVPDAGYAGMFRQTVGGALENAKNLGNVLQLDTKLNEYEILRYFTSRADLNAAASGAFVDGWGTTNLTVYIKPIEGNPRKSGRVYRVANDVPLEITGNNAVVSDLTARNPGGQDGAIKALGYGHVVRRCRFLNGSRHNALIGFDCVVEDNYFGGGANGAEPAIGGGNTLVVFSGSIDKRYMVLRRNVHDAREQTFVSGPLWHAGISDSDVPSSILMEDEVYIGINTCLNGGVTPPGGLLNYRPRYVTSPGGLVCNIMTGSSAQIHSPTGEVNGCHENYAIDVSIFDADLRIPDVGNGRYGFCFVQGITTGGPNTRLIGGEYRIAPVGITNGFAIGTSAIANYTAGTFEARGARFVTEGTVLGHLLWYGWNVGHDGGTGTVSGGGNTYPYGVKFAINGTTYPTLAAAQAAGYEPGSKSQQIRAPIATSGFDVPDGTPLENVPGWSLLGGASGTIVVQGGKPRSTSGQPAAYKRGDLPALGGYVSWKNTGSADYSYACTHVIDRLNFMGAFVTGKNIEAYAFVDGAPRQIIAVNNATVPGDRITLAYRVINDATGEIRFWLYVNDETLDVRAVIQPKFAGVRAAGIGSHNASAAILDDFQIGPL